MIVYKLIHQRKGGTVGPLFINRKLRIPFNKWLDAEDHPTKGFAHRPYWHCSFDRVTHLKLKSRVWCKCEVDSYSTMDYRDSVWVLADRIRFSVTYLPFS